MNEYQAQQEGLHFTGIYSSDKEEVKKRIAESRTKYPKARIVLVNVPSFLRVGYTAYADNIYSAYENLQELSERITTVHESNVKYYTDEFNKKMKEENDQM